VAVFVDGCYWHGCPEHGRIPNDPSGYWAAKLSRNKSRDAANNEALEALGWRVLRFWEHEDVDAAASKIEAAVRSRSAGESDPTQ
jgi:DNA mismatch endonuclease (patch repair protein)